MVKTRLYTFNIPEELRMKLQKVSEITGLRQAEIIRRGILREIMELEKFNRSGGNESKN